MTTVVCPACGKSFALAKASQLRPRKSVRYCSYVCGVNSKRRKIVEATQRATQRYQAVIVDGEGRSNER